MESSEIKQLREENARGRITLALFSGFVGLVIGLLTPVYVFGQRLAVNEVRTAEIVVGVKEIQQKLDATNTAVSKMREDLARKGIPIR